MKKRERIQWMGLLGVVSLLSYVAAMVFAPLAYPGYNWIAQAVSDLSATNAPSRELWNQLSCLYGVCGMISIMMVCVAVKERENKVVRLGIYLFAVMSWLSSVGYTMFPLSSSGYAGMFQDIMHVYVVTAGVVVLSIISLILITVGGFRKNTDKLLAICALITLIWMMAGAIGTNALPKQYFGIPERFSVLSAASFNAILGVHLFRGKFEKQMSSVVWQYTL